MARRHTGGIGLGGIVVIVGIVVMIVWSFWVGLIITLVGLIAFGGFAKESGTERRCTARVGLGRAHPYATAIVRRTAASLS